jgi:glycosyltransferase involved in cell wall biosynthesis
VLERPLISVCILTRYRPVQLDACLASLQAQAEAPAWELLVAADRERRVSELVMARFPDATIGLVTGAFPGAARNFLIERARGELLLFLDDDVVVRADLLARLGHLATRHPHETVFGGPNQTPRGSTSFQMVQGAVLASLVAAGPVRRRYGAHPAGRADERSFTLCNLAVRREAMLPFSSELVCAEENAVLAALSSRGDRMYYDPELVVYHERRPTLSTFARQMHKYGQGRGQLLVRRPATFRPAYLIPSLVLLYAIAAIVAAVAGWRLALAPLAVYLAAVVAAAVRIQVSVHRRFVVPQALVLVMTVHVCYGVGVLRGLVKRRRQSVASWIDLRTDAVPAGDRD